MIEIIAYVLIAWLTTSITCAIALYYIVTHGDWPYEEDDA